MIIVIVFYLQSGPVTSWWSYHTLDAAAGDAQIIAERTSCDYTDLAFLDCLRQIDADLLTNLTLDLVPKPLVDGITLQDEPFSLMRSGRFHKVDVLLGKFEHRFAPSFHQLWTSILLTYIVRR